MGDLSIKIVDANALPEFKVLVDRMKSTSSRTGKEEILKEYKDNTGVKFILYFVYNPYIITGISKKKIDKARNVTVDLKGESYGTSSTLSTTCKLTITAPIKTSRWCVSS